MSEEADQEKRVRAILWGCLAGLGILLILGMVYTFAGGKWEVAGQIGDTMNVLTCLFAGGAFLATTWVAISQVEQLRLAKQQAGAEARQQRERSSELEEKAAQLQKKRPNPPRSKAIYEILNDPTVTEARGILQGYRVITQDMSMSRAKDMTVKKYELAGIMCRRDYVNLDAARWSHGAGPFCFAKCTSPSL